MEVNVKLIKCDVKLQFIKIVKEYTGLGLREAKDLCENCLEKGYEKFTIKNRDYNNFVEELKSIGEFEFSGGLAYEREGKVLSLGIGEREDYISYILDKSKMVSFEKNSEVLAYLLDRLDKEELMVVLEKFMEF